LEIIAHSDGRVDVSSLTSFIASYQSETTLTLGELWAIPIMLRLAVIENLRRIAGKIALDVIDHNLADHWADRMVETVKEKPETDPCDCRYGPFKTGTGQSLCCHLHT
jgi:hypothetical protein